MDRMHPAVAEGSPPEELTLPVVRRPFEGVVRVPGSKSLTNRALVLASMATGVSDISNVLLADDTLVMLEALKALGHRVELDEAARTVRVEGSGGDVPHAAAELMCGNSGTTLRFLAAAVARGRGRYRFDGIARMRQRPVGGLGQLLQNLGVRVSYEQQPGFPPMWVDADRLPGGTLLFGTAESSQFLSAVLMVAPFARHEVRVNLTGPQTSWPYVAMTMRLMDHFGHYAELERDEDTGEPTRIVVPRGIYRAGPYVVEPDASNASYFLAAAAVNPGSRVRLDGLGGTSLQGDIAAATLLESMGAAVELADDHITLTGPERLDGITADLSGTPDLAQTLAVVAAFARSPSTFTGLHTLRVKETDRIAALQTELTRLGCAVAVSEDRGVSLTVVPPPGGVHRPAAIDTYDDHRMAMAFAVAATRIDGLVIRNPMCCAKTYPGFFDDLRALLRG
ncbi:MAG: 3-phosphoshikimate 1-carboxyvinyltransferase [Tepidisphaerales bacterium]